MYACIFMLAFSALFSLCTQINPAVSSLNFGDVLDGEISADGASQICAALRAVSKAESLQARPRIRKVDLSGNRIGNAGAEACAELIRVSIWLQELRLSHCALSCQVVPSLISALRGSTCIKLIDLSGNIGIGSDGHMAIGAFLHFESSLEALHMGFDDFDDGGFKALAEGLKVNRSLQELHLQSIGLNGAISLVFDALRENSSLRLLNLSYCDIDEHVEALSAVLRVNSGLEYLDLSNSDIGGRGAAFLGEALHINTTLRTLDLASNDIGDEGALALGIALGRNSSLTCIKLDCNSISDVGAVALGEALCASPAMTVLDLGFNKIGSLGAECIRRAQSENSRLDPVRLDGNPCKRYVNESCYL